MGWMTTERTIWLLKNRMHLDNAAFISARQISCKSIPRAAAAARTNGQPPTCPLLTQHLREAVHSRSADCAKLPRSGCVQALWLTTLLRVLPCPRVKATHTVRNSMFCIVLQQQPSVRLCTTCFAVNTLHDGRVCLNRRFALVGSESVVLYEHLPASKGETERI